MLYVRMAAEEEAALCAEKCYTFSQPRRSRPPARVANLKRNEPER